MKYYSTNKQAPMASLQEAVVKGLAADRGLFMPIDRKSTRLNSSHSGEPRMPSSA